MSYAQVGPGAALGRFFGVVTEGRAYRRLVFLALAFPLGLTYFVTLVVMFSVGIGLAVILIGIPILGVAIALTLAFLALERLLAQLLLDVEFEEAMRPEADSLGAFVRSVLFVRRTWLGMVYLPSKLFVGIGAFVLLWSTFGVALSLLATPLYYESAHVGIHLQETIHLTPDVGVGWGGREVELVVPVRIGSWVADSLLDALAVSALGLCLLLASLHVTNLAGRILGVYARVMLR